MCYPKPGPRCTTHAKKRLLRAQAAVKGATTETQQHLAMFELIAAEKQFYITKGGLEYLQEKINNGEDPDNQYLLKLRSAQKERKERLASVKAMTEEAEPEPEEQHQGDFPRGEVLNLDKSAGLPASRYLDSIAPLSEFRAALEARLIQAAPHPDPDVPYASLNYTTEAQFYRAWNDVTNNCRGLIVNTKTGEIVARPFSKFFNDQEEAGEHNNFPRTGPVLVADKLDGSMGIAYQHPDGRTAIATRGSMNSEQALHATALYAEKYEGKWSPRPDTTYMYEIIYPQNRIVLDYGDKDDLVLIGAVNKTTGRSIPVTELTEWPGERAKQYEYASYAEAVAAPIADDKEGMVIHFLDSDKRVKLKGEHYLYLHKVATEVTPRSVWEALRDGRYESWAASIPDEFSDGIKKYGAGMQKKYAAAVGEIENRTNEVRQQFGIAPGEKVPAEKRKALAAHTYRAYPKSLASRIMTYIDRNEINGMMAKSIWRELRPDPNDII